ncbi:MULTISPECIES: DUF599 domain-containing protein [Marinobacter]|uniref:DUF599 domain-containing protein n=1 Tax=Marinobacter xestospongiae TaxID=994319 RepID=A0ABU3W2I3_9GAMM|nr:MULTISPECIES: DUF599 domain-containing protein [Marinobacter]MCG8519479.1 DUF599 domain-containing protein [Pseudomonadales bacterium]MCK7566869.1 DUF599 domain-containing protein [Marinobacter xestospongiae]MDV2080724.1 DUF599 domain-containing protein [Marinobacter xestospongiae]UDL03610.1 DUF599 domain-containing protein [Marinobacter sp. CA1]
MKESLDLLALLWFLVCWLGYSEYSRRRADDRPCLSNTLDLYREDWMRVMLRRDNRISDASVVGNLERNGAFFASSCLLILAGIITALGYTQEVMEVFSTLPFGNLPSRAIWELRMVVLMVVFIYAFFKFTWSMRMYNFVAVLIGGAPFPGDKQVSPASREAFARSAAQVCNMAGDAFNLGLRSYYYALAVVAWFIHPVAFLAASTLVVFVLYRREFRSAALTALRSGKVFEEPSSKAPKSTKQTEKTERNVEGKAD